MTKAEYESVIDKLRLTNGVVWPIPITLDISREFMEKCKNKKFLFLRNDEGFVLAVMEVKDVWEPDKYKEALSVYGTLDETHPGVDYLLNQSGQIYIGGGLVCGEKIQHYDFLHLRHAPDQLKQFFTDKGWNKIVAFQTRNPMHRAHFELTLRAIEDHNAKLLIHPVVGATKRGDIDYYNRVKCYEKILPYYPKNSVTLNLLPLAMRMAGPKEALWHAIIRKNYGCTHFIVGRDHAGPGLDSKGQAFYDPYAAQDCVKKYEEEIGIQMIPFQEMVYVANKNKYLSVENIHADDNVKNISGTEFRARLKNGEDVPDWFSFSEVVNQLRSLYSKKSEQGFTVFFTGLSGAGKSTLANALLTKLRELTNRTISLLDGDIVRKNLSSELSFSKEHRRLNILRIGYVAHEITKHHGIAICAPIAPYNDVRNQVRSDIESVGGFVEIYVSTPLSTCEQRDTKGLYAKARSGQLKQFTGIDDPYEPPLKPELNIDTTNMSILCCLTTIVDKLRELGYLDVDF